jgi:DEAD/DEAH box helicase domain-containing protein
LWVMKGAVTHWARPLRGKRNPVMRVTAGDIREFIRGLAADNEFGPELVHHRHLEAEAPSYAGADAVDPALAGVLEGAGVTRLYRHQAEALALLREGRNVLVATPTASGKTLIYNLAVLEAIKKVPTARALYVFPLKALENDQIKTLESLCRAAGAPPVSAAVYDGDTSAYRRKRIRSSVPGILFTNPDMLHRAILPHHESWRDLFGNLSFVVLDEVHTYRGIFGSHMNQVIRRLRRVCSLYGSRPRFIMLSATVQNPGEFGGGLIQDQVEVVDAGGAPRPDRHFVFMNPGAGTNFTAARLFVRSLRAGFRTIAFTQARKVTELMYIWASRLAPDLRERISSYRAGFMPGERREIERSLAGGSILGVISTSALELGIDIGHLDVCILVGYPGTVINTWQRGGRVGRAGRSSLVVLVAKPDALDQYFMRHPDNLFERGFEAAVLDPDNPHVTRAHLVCAAAEHPLTLSDSETWPAGFQASLDALEESGKLTRSADAPPTWYAAGKRPHLDVNIRSVGLTYTIFDAGSGAAFGTVDEGRAFKECHPGAVYLHRGRHFLVERLDLGRQDVIARPADLKYFTRVRSEKETEILEILRSRPEGRFLVREGRLRVTEQVTGYEKRALRGQELLGVVPLDLPSRTFETVGFWIEIEEVIRRMVEDRGLHFMGGIHAIEHGTIGMFPLFALCDRNDIGGICYPRHPDLGKGAIFIYDGYPGGVGLAHRGFDVAGGLLEHTLDHVRECDCEEGCPSCIHSPKCGSGNKPLDKAAALFIMECLLGRVPLAAREGDAEEDSGPPPEAAKAVDRAESAVPRIVFLDLETRMLAEEVGGWRNTHLMRVSVAVTYDTREEAFLCFTEDRVDDLLEHLFRADLVVGFNVRRFDYGVLKAYSALDLNKLNTFDILEDVHRKLGYRLGLDHLARETLKRGKTADGLQAVKWFRQGDMDRLTAYCRDDVAATRDLFNFGLEHGHLVYRLRKEDRRVRLRLDWRLEDMLEGHDRR